MHRLFKTTILTQKYVDRITTQNLSSNSLPGRVDTDRSHNGCSQSELEVWRRERALNLRFKAVTRPLSLPDGLASGAMKPIPIRCSPSLCLWVCPRIPKGTLPENKDQSMRAISYRHGSPFFPGGEVWL